jgi:hypothetical protein
MSRAVIVIVLDPFFNFTPLTDQEVVPTAVPLPSPRSADHVTSVTPPFPVAVPARLTVSTDVV